MTYCLMDGNEAVARAAMASGCRFFAGYPITPATGILNSMLALLPPAGGVCLQGEDEIASIGYCLGASMAGMKVMTATSGPGISLYSEQISFAIGSEIPIVIVDVQRLGPSTGSATRGADGDIQFLRWGNSGGMPVIVLAPVDVQDCYELTVQAFNLAEIHRCPVFIASNKEVAMTRESLDTDILKIPEIVRRRAPKGEKPYLPFTVETGRYVPDFRPMGGNVIVRQTSSTHGPDGHITADPAEIAANRKRLMEKLADAPDFFSFEQQPDRPETDPVVITYGVTARAARAAAKELREEGIHVALLILKSLWPVPGTTIVRYTRNAAAIAVIEMNLGQYVHEIKRLVPDRPVRFFGRMDGALITPQQIKEVIRHAGQSAE
ncbi:MAG: transketolase C-terminal domain-containing protein [Thermodesulfobacteriota bacterium]